MAKLIRAYRSSSYGPPLVTDKYSPLRDIDFSDTDEGYCSSLVTRRWEILSGMGLLPQPLRLIMEDWETAIESEGENYPPLVVISTNRSKWIKKGVEAANFQLGKLKTEQFDNASDLRSLTALAKQKLSPPMYCPVRIGAAASPRNVYVVVHAAEYDTYKTNLAGTEIKVVGWQFKPPRRRAVPLCGFGASRFAAIEFCKHLRTEAGEPWDYAWLLDDNVIAFTSFAGYLKVEEAMDKAKKAKKPQICAGFRGGTATISPTENKEWSERELTEGDAARARGETNYRGKQYAELPTLAATGLVQQAALWNIAEMTTKKLNFGPIFVTSGEDVSIGNYFDWEEIPYLYYEGIKIRKEDVENDNSAGAKTVTKGREKLTALMAKMERSEDRARTFLLPPPPIKIKPLIMSDDTVRDDTEQTIAQFIAKSVLPNASDETKAKATDTATRKKAMCQAVEQTICKAIKLGHVSEAALGNAFKINGTKTQTVDQVDG